MYRVSNTHNINNISIMTCRFQVDLLAPTL